jgi:hypothetical protein
VTLRWVMVRAGSDYGWRIGLGGRLRWVFSPRTADVLGAKTNFSLPLPSTVKSR